MGGQPKLPKWVRLHPFFNRETQIRLTSAWPQSVRRTVCCAIPSVAHVHFLFTSELCSPERLQPLILPRPCRPPELDAFLPFCASSFSHFCTDSIALSSPSYPCLPERVPSLTSVTGPDRPTTDRRIAKVHYIEPPLQFGRPDSASPYRPVRGLCRSGLLEASSDAFCLLGRGSSQSPAYHWNALGISRVPCPR